MNIGWQDAVTVGLVVAAAVYVIRRVWRLAGGDQPTGCGNCPDCSASSDKGQLISIDPPPKS